jgi:hypothetical protein
VAALAAADCSDEAGDSEAAGVEHIAGRRCSLSASSAAIWAAGCRKSLALPAFRLKAGTDTGRCACFLADSPPSLSGISFRPTPTIPALVFPATFRETLLNPSNPWTRPGVIRNRPTTPVKLPQGDADPELYKRVRWDTIPSDGIHPDYGQGGAQSLMVQLADGIAASTQPDGWAWAVNKTILGVGDSLMRNNVIFFADHVSHGKARSHRPRLSALDALADWLP